MTTRKSQNSILFLTTLGVYLGLVLVGATPQVLAQAATTRNFDITEENGQVENLDKDLAKGLDGHNSVATKIRRSVSAFIAEFTDVSVCGSALNPVKPRRGVFLVAPALYLTPKSPELSLTKTLSPRHLARASL